MDNAHTPTEGPIEPPPTFAIRLVTFATVVVPILGLAAAVILLWGVAFSWVYLAILGAMYVATGLGVTVGYHRFFTHRSFKAPRWVAVVMAALGSMAVEGPMLEWVATHRKHHQHSDTDGDPHSPHTHGHGLWNFFRGVFHAHTGWMLTAGGDRARRRARGDDAPTHPVGMKATLARYVKDLEREPSYRWMSKTFPLWAVVGLLIPALLGGLLTLSWTGVLLGFLWGGLVRVLLLHHVTWSINSVCHIWGTRPYRSNDHSRNNAIFGVLALGEGWHNNHHAFPASARHGLRWWQLDVSYIVILIMERLGMASDVRTPSRELVHSRRASATR